MEKERELRKCRESIREVWRTNEFRSEKARKDRYGGGKRFQKGNTTGKVHGKVVIWIGRWKVWNRIPEKVGKELAKVEVSFSKGETLKGG